MLLFLPIPILHSQLLALALQKSGVDVTLVRAVDEHHGFSKPWQQHIDALRLAFFEKHLKG